MARAGNGGAQVKERQARRTRGEEDCGEDVSAVSAEVQGPVGHPPPENGLGPTGEEAADEDELADVVGIVVGEQESLAEERLVIGVRDGREEIG